MSTLCVNKKILLCGSGFVAGPFLDYMLRRPENVITVASRRLERAVLLANGKPNTTPIQLDVNDEAALDAVVKEHDIIVSLIPYTFHALIIKSAIKFKKHFVSTSYISPAMDKFNDEAIASDVTVMNEIGVDPGIDHLYAMKTIDEVHAAGGKVLSFTSFCGGLPAPEASNNPLGYKFSWSPRGVLLALLNTAKYKENGESVVVPGSELLKSARDVFIYPAFALQGYGNRDSLPYEQRYGIPEAQTIIRGSLRYKGNPAFLQVLSDLGLMDITEQDFLCPDATPMTWAATLAKRLGCSSTDEATLISAVITKANLVSDTPETDRIIRGLKWLGLFRSDGEVARQKTYLDALVANFEGKMHYGPGERDMILMQHRFEVERSDGRHETITSTMCEYGIPHGATAMSRTVGIPCGIATQLILDGQISRRGVFAPLTSDLYLPLIESLEKEGLRCVEEII